MKMVKVKCVKLVKGFAFKPQGKTVEVGEVVEVSASLAVKLCDRGFERVAVAPPIEVAAPKRVARKVKGD